MNCSRYEGKKTDIKEVIDLAETLPFFAERRLIVFEDTVFFKSGGGDWQIISMAACLRLHILFFRRAKWITQRSV